MPLYKLLMTWNIIPGQEQAYVEFNNDEFVPRLLKLGLQPMDSWFTIFGEVPQISVGWVSDDADLLRQLLDSEDWVKLQDQLDEYVTEFVAKVVPVTGYFQE